MSDEPNLGDEPKPAKPVTDPVPTDEELEQMDEPGHEDVPEDDILPPEAAEQDDTVDDKEDDTAS